MNKVQVFNSYFDAFCGTNHQNHQTHKDFYKYATNQLRRSLNKDSFTDEEVQETIEEITFWACYHFAKYSFRTDEDLMDVEVENLPINMNTKDFTTFKTAIEIVVNQYQEIADELGRKQPLSMEKNFNYLLTRTEKFTMKIPLVWLGT